MKHYFAHLFDAGWQSSPSHLIAVVWFCWAISWFIAAIWSRQTAARASFMQEAPYRIITVVGVVMLFGFVQFASLPSAWELSDSLLWALLALTVVGFLFAWWARLHLGTLWSGTITRKQGHRVVDTGPYAMVRHPIYTGLLLSAFATAAARGRWEALAGALLFALGCWIKARQEEQFLSETLGSDYAAYRQRVHMLVPYLL
jgi:protein-S-isoprenylcysteine O-methyltransferase Ste14